MPQSPFTRYFALFIICAFAFALLYPHEWAMEWGKKAIYVLPLVLGILGWSATRDAPPFDDRAFHRTLPPGDGPAFRRTLLTHLLVLGGITLVVMAYCWHFGIVWQIGSYGVLFLTLPAWAIMAATGIATSIGSSRNQWRSLGYIAVLASPIFSWVIVDWATKGLENSSIREVFLTPKRTVVLTAAVLYPLVWWLVAARRQRRLGAVFAAAIGALLPWLYVYGDFVQVENRGVLEERRWNDFEQRLGPQTVKWSRLPYKEESDKWMPVQEVFAVEGLQKGEVAQIFPYVSTGKTEGRRVWALREDLPPEEGGVTSAGVLASLAPDGSVEWGSDALWNRLREQLPAHESFGIWGRAAGTPARLVLLRPGTSTDYTYPQEARTYENHYTVNAWRNDDWEMFSSASTYELLGDFEVSKGGSTKAPFGGKVIVDPMVEKGGKYLISFKHYLPGLQRADEPWLEADVIPWFLEPRVIVTDASGKHAYGMEDLSSSNSQPVWLGGMQQWVVFMGEPKTPEMVAKLEALKGGRIYLFWAKPRSLAGKVTLPPP